MKRVPLILLLGSAIAGCAAAPGKHTQAPSQLLIANVTAITLSGADIDDAAVLVEGDRIVAVGPLAAMSVPAGTATVDGQGGYLMPGLVDMHVHIPPLPGEHGDPAWRLMTVMLANGITTARSMAGHASHLALREAINKDDRLAPTLYVASPAVHQGSAPDTAAARAAVAAAVDAGFDLIKSHHLEDPAVWRAVQEAAAAQGIPVSGHVSNAVGLAAALEQGQQIEHLDGFIHALLPVDSPLRAVPFGQIPPAAVLAAVEQDRMDQLAEQVATSGVAITPTLALFERIADVATPTEALRALPEMRYVSPPALKQWTQQRAGLVASGALLSIGPDFVALRSSLVAALDRAGALLMAGSDTPQMFHHAGFGLHDEIQALGWAGLAPRAALVTATVNPASYLSALPEQGSAIGRPADFGSIAPGQRADLLLLRQDPRKDLEALEHVEAVMLRGRWLDRQALDQLLEDVARAAAAG